MKTSALAFVLLVGLPLIGFGQASAPRWRDPSDPALASHIADAKVSLQLLVSTLSATLAEAVQDGGPHQAVVVCQVRALPLTAGAAQQRAPHVTALKRTSLQVRNPANAPDAAEQAALARVAQLLADGESVPPLLVQELDATADRDAEIRVYKPLNVGAQCLACHGDRQTFSPALRSTLANRYPRDAATGYREGDWRGLIRVSLDP